MMTYLAKRTALRLRFSAVARATALFLAVAFGAVASGLAVSARAAPPAGGGALKPPENPFQERGKQEPGKTDRGREADATSDETAGDPDDQDAESGSEERASDEASTSGSERDDAEEDEGALHGLACLEGDVTGGRRKGVQRRDFLKRHRVELAGVGGYYASDVLSSTYTYGGAIAFYPSEDFGLELLVTRSPVKFRLEEPFNAFDNMQRFQGGAAWQGIVSLLWSPIHAKFKFTEATIIHADLFAVAGAGRTFHDTVLGLTWEAGFGVKLYFSRFVTFRLDIRDFLLPQEVLGRGRVTNNINILAGFSVWLG